MKRRTFKTMLAVALLSLAVLNRAETKWELPPDNTTFKPGPGVEQAMANCVICHSADYIATQPPLDRNAWGAIVLKMREKYGAPVLTNNVEAIVQYLSSTYGKSDKR